jgi:hypothetical protein
MNFLNKLSILNFSLLVLITVSCSKKISNSENKTSSEKIIPLAKPIYSDPTKAMSNEQLYQFDSLFNVSYSNKLHDWKTRFEASLNCEIVFHTARDGYALCINFINFKDSSILKMNIDTIIESISDNEFEKIEKPLNYIHTRRIMNWKDSNKYNLRFSGSTYQQYQFRAVD